MAAIPLRMVAGLAVVRPTLLFLVVPGATVVSVVCQRVLDRAVLLCCGSVPGCFAPD